MLMGARRRRGSDRGYGRYPDLCSLSVSTRHPKDAGGKFSVPVTLDLPCLLGSGHAEASSFSDRPSIHSSTGGKGLNQPLVTEES